MSAKPDPTPSSRPPLNSGAGARQGRRRPWYLAAAMCLMWLMGVVGMMSGCEEIDYLRGSQDMPTQLEQEADDADHPLSRALVVRQRAWVEALARHHQRAFPVAVMRMLVAVVLIVGAGGALVGRPSSRSLTLQAIAASVLVAAASFWLLAPVRYETAHAVAADAVGNTVSVPQGRTRSEVMAEQHQLAMQREQSVVLFQILIYGFAALALTRRRTKEYFASLSESVIDAGS